MRSENTPETSCILNIPHTVDDVQCDINIKIFSVSRRQKYSTMPKHLKILKLSPRRYLLTVSILRLTNKICNLPPYFFMILPFMAGLSNGLLLS
jgi:hypothetical protein